MNYLHVILVVRWAPSQRRYTYKHDSEYEAGLPGMESVYRVSAASHAFQRLAADELPSALVSWVQRTEHSHSCALSKARRRLRRAVGEGRQAWLRNPTSRVGLFQRD